MHNLQFHRLPLSARLATCLSFFLAWVMLAEFVIDRYGFDRYLPFYRVGDVCPYEFVVLLAIAVFWMRAHRRTRCT